MKTSLGIDTISATFRETVCAVVVTYYPDSGLFGRIEKVVKQVGQTVIVDNGSPESCLEQIREVADKFATHLHLVLNPSNEGVASALNTGTRWAASQGYRWVLTLDQDTTVAPNMIASLEEVARCYPLPESLAVIGSNYRDKTNGRVLCDDAIGSDSSPGREVTVVLTSGSLVSVRAFQTIGGFRDDFFIDCVDFEYCLRARARGFHIALTSKPVMEHGIGSLIEHRFLWRRVGTSNHSPSRQYFLARNSVLLGREYIDREPRWILKYLWLWAKSIVLVCLFEKERVQKAKNIIRGCVDGFLGRTSWKPS